MYVMRWVPSLHSPGTCSAELPSHTGHAAADRNRKIKLQPSQVPRAQSGGSCSSGVLARVSQRSITTEARPERHDRVFLNNIDQWSRWGIGTAKISAAFSNIFLILLTYWSHLQIQLILSKYQTKTDKENQENHEQTKNNNNTNVCILILHYKVNIKMSY